MLTCSPIFWPRSDFFRFYIIKIAEVGLRLKVEIVEMKEFHAKILFLVQPFSTHEHLAPKFGRAANFFRFYIIEMKEFHTKILFLVQPFSTHEHSAPNFGRAANFFRFYIIKIANVGIRMKVEIVEMKVFYDKIFISTMLFQKVNI